MRASLLNRQITIEIEETTTNSVGTPTEGYGLLKETWASVSTKSGDTSYTGEGALPFTKVEFVIRYDPRVNYKCRILFNTQYYEIGHIETIGRNHFLKLTSTVFEGEDQNGE